MSSDQGPGAPSFGDLFDDPHAPLLPVDPSGRPGVPPVGRPAAPATSTPVATDPEPVPVAEDPSHDEPAAEVENSDTEDADDTGAADDVPDADQYDVIDDEAVSAGDDEPVAVAVPVVAAAAAAPVRPWQGEVDSDISSAPATRVDTGRLYRSAGAEGPATQDAIPAIDPGYTPARPAAAAAAQAPVQAAAPVAASGTGLTYTGVVVVVVAATVLVGFADALINDKLGILTGIALAASSLYAAIVVRRPDIWAAVVVPPLAFLAAALTAGQLTLDKSGSLLIREGYMLFRTLAVNAPWILGTTVVCLVIVLVRRRRS